MFEKVRPVTTSPALTFAAFTLPLSVTVFPLRLPTMSAAIVDGRAAEFDAEMPVSSAPLPMKYAAVALPLSVAFVPVTLPTRSAEITPGRDELPTFPDIDAATIDPAHRMFADTTSAPGFTLTTLIPLAR